MTFVALEGIDACGKATQSKLLASKLTPSVLFAFPDYISTMGALVGAHLRREWRACVDYDFATKLAAEQGVAADEHKLNALVFQALQLANRCELATEIKRRLELGHNVVADRYTASGMVYGSADGIDLDYLIQIHEVLPQPDRWLLLDIDPELSAQRRPERRDRYESQPGLMQDVATRYRELWARQGWTIIDGRGTVDEVEGRIWEAVTRK